jgi:hypothetical protein
MTQVTHVTLFRGTIYISNSIWGFLKSNVIASLTSHIQFVELVNIYAQTADHDIAYVLHTPGMTPFFLYLFRNHILKEYIMTKPDIHYIAYFDGACEPVNPGGTASYGGCDLRE